MPLTEGFLIIYGVIMAISVVQEICVAVLGTISKLDMDSVGTFYAINKIRHKMMLDIF